eukprot:CAMPEP_0168404000 /NCGR_PEP_ID=MMETSP0228-20121227/24415_1 /TAXON_ID=133427 /ORGANISM="Protoceratium reticulatum, Strain CCCM 535 (=CCMP 1889)" /LENGTH=34 /DNA_ID= /DNA_START= /DNA_END= /DNA_ORIENTATION=
MPAQIEASKPKKTVVHKKKRTPTRLYSKGVILGH